MYPGVTKRKDPSKQQQRFYSACVKLAKAELSYEKNQEMVHLLDVTEAEAHHRGQSDVRKDLNHDLSRNQDGVHTVERGYGEAVVPDSRMATDNSALAQHQWQDSRIRNCPTGVTSSSGVDGRVAHRMEETRMHPAQVSRCLISQQTYGSGSKDSLHLGDHYEADDWRQTGCGTSMTRDQGGLRRRSATEPQNFVGAHRQVDRPQEACLTQPGIIHPQVVERQKDSALRSESAGFEVHPARPAPSMARQDVPTYQAGHDTYEEVARKFPFAVTCGTPKPAAAFRPSRHPFKNVGSRQVHPGTKYPSYPSESAGNGGFTHRSPVPHNFPGQGQIRNNSTAYRTASPVKGSEYGQLRPLNRFVRPAKFAVGRKGASSDEHQDGPRLRAPTPSPNMRRSAQETFSNRQDLISKPDGSDTGRQVHPRNSKQANAARQFAEPSAGRPVSSDSMFRPPSGVNTSICMTSADPRPRGTERQWEKNSQASCNFQQPDTQSPEGLMPPKAKSKNAYIESSVQMPAPAHFGMEAQGQQMRVAHMPERKAGTLPGSKNDDYSLSVGKDKDRNSWNTHEGNHPPNTIHVAASEHNGKERSTVFTGKLAGIEGQEKDFGNAGGEMSRGFALTDKISDIDRKAMPNTTKEGRDT